MDNVVVSVAENVCLDMMLLWISCNVCCKLDELIKSYRDLNKVLTGERGDKFYGRLEEFKDKLKEIFDVKCTDDRRQKRQETLWGIKETAEGK